MKDAGLVCLWLLALSSSVLEEENNSARGPGRQPSHQPGVEGGGDSNCGKKTLELWGLLTTLNSCQHGSQYGIGISDDYVAMIIDPVARAHVEVAADTLDCLAREFRYY